MTARRPGPARPEASLTLGPLLFNWDPDRWSDFYARIADEAPVDRVCLGEVVCSKRLPFYIDRIPQAIERLQRSGKTVALSSLGLVTLERERRMCAELAASGGIEVEVNDLTMLSHLRRGHRMSVGPLVNVYNPGTIAFLAERGAVRFCLPPELPIGSMGFLSEAAAAHGATVEVWAFGRIPLAISGRCYHARLHGLTKDGCQFVCGEDPDGLQVDTLDGEPFLAVNGVQTLSQTYGTALAELPELTALGVAGFRLSPHGCDMVEVARTFRRVLDGGTEIAAAMRHLSGLLPGCTLSNGFLKGSWGAAPAMPSPRPPQPQ